LSIGIISLIIIYIGCLIPMGKHILTPVLSIIQVSYFTILQYDQLPLTYMGIKNLKYSNGYNYNYNQI
jgi:uncharacterized Tic20 family protein